MSDIPKPEPLAPEHVSGAKLYANRHDAMECWPFNGVIAELGVAFGSFSNDILRRLRPTRFDSYDTFKLHEMDVLWGRPVQEKLGDATHREFYESRFRAEIDAGQMRVFEGDGATRMLENTDTVYDLIYVDGSHQYNVVQRDAEAAVARVAPDGMLVFNDYTMANHNQNIPYGVVQAVNRLCRVGGWKVKYFSLHPEMFCDVGLFRG